MLLRGRRPQHRYTSRLSPTVTVNVASNSIGSCCQLRRTDTTMGFKRALRIFSSPHSSLARDRRTASVTRAVVSEGLCGTATCGGSTLTALSRLSKLLYFSGSIVEQHLCE